LIELEKTNKEIKYIIAYEECAKRNYMKTYGNEGLEFIDEVTLEKQRSVISYIIGKIGSNLVNGKSVMNVSLPIYIFDSRSLLDTFAYDYRLASHYLEKAAMISDKLERIKLITTYYITAFHFSLALTKPFNPIIGETFQAKVGNNLVYLEQTSHHPPISHYYVKNPNFVSYGYINIEPSTGPNTLTADNKGLRIVKLNDGTTYQIKMPKFYMTGLSVGNRFVNFVGNLVVEDIVKYTNLDK
jgi:hypothetical protein